jgi:hypothetical protein
MTNAYEDLVKAKREAESTMSEPIEDIEDCKRIQKIAKAHGHNFSLKVCEAIWRSRSEDWAASWLFLPRTDEEVWDDLVTWGIEYPDEL